MVKRDFFCFTNLKMSLCFYNAQGILICDDINKQDDKGKKFQSGGTPLFLIERFETSVNNCHNVSMEKPTLDIYYEVPGTRNLPAL